MYSAAEVDPDVNMARTTNSGWLFASDELGGWTQAAGFADFNVPPLPPPIPA
jgi:hypothetical protein